MEVSGLRSFHFLHPAWLLALPVLFAIAVVCLRRRGRGEGAWARVVDAHLLPLLRLAGAGRARTPWLLVIPAWTLAALALAGPTWQRKPSAGYRAPGAWVLLLDLSPSMAATDLLPDRAARARFAIADLLSAAQDARVALVAFAGEPYTVTPLTTDVATIRTLLSALSPSLMPETGHDLAPALARAQQLLRGGNAGRGQVVVLSDGFDDEAPALAAAKRLAEEGVTVNAVGVGTASGAPERDTRGEFIRGPRGDILVSRLRTRELRRLAAAGDGRFVTVDGIPALVAALRTERSRSLDGRFSLTAAHVSSWRNDGVWLLPPLLILTALFARKGWL